MGGEAAPGMRGEGGVIPEKVLVVHNGYLLPGGEDLVFEEETALLEEHGHSVLRLRMHNDQAASMNGARLAGKTLWNHAAYREVRALIRSQRPGIVHFHNTFPLISPSAHHAAAAEGVPVVQTLHNYRLLCPNGLFFRDGRPCEDCLGKTLPLPGVVHACYRDSRKASGVTAAMLAAHRIAGTWSSKVDAYIALTEFARRKFVEGGLPENRISVKPNFVSPDPGAGDGRGGYALFVGRLSREKGVGTLLEAWDRLGAGALPLKVVGDGPLAASVTAAVGKNPRVEWLGQRTPEDVRRLMKGAAMLVVPSEVYETFGRVAAEAFAAGTPVVAAKIGAVGELVRHGRNGVHFRSGDAADLARQIGRLTAGPDGLSGMRRGARREYEEKYTAERNYGLLARIYAAAVERGRKEQ